MFLGDLPPFGQLRFTCSSFKFWLLWGYLGWHSITQTKMWFIKTEHTNFWFEATLFPLFCFITNNSFSKNNTEWMAAVVIVLLTAKALICSLVSMRKPSHEKLQQSLHWPQLTQKEGRESKSWLIRYFLSIWCWIMAVSHVTHKWDQSFPCTDLQICIDKLFPYTFTLCPWCKKTLHKSLSGEANTNALVHKRMCM